MRLVLEHVCGFSTLLVCLCFFSCQMDEDSADLSHVERPVIGGFADPGELDFEIYPWERNAVGAQIVSYMGTDYQGCSATLIGDRIAVAAGHCVILNQEDWIYGSDPILLDPDMYFFVVGDDIDEPVCRLQAEEIRLHPDIEVTTLINHDVSLILLKDSVLENCPNTIPLQANMDLLTDDMVGELLLQGGFGSTDGTYDYSSIKYWALVEVTEVSTDLIVVENVEMGFPTRGDSGAGMLHRFPDGSLRTLGVVSTGTTEIENVSRFDTENTWFQSLFEPDNLCGSVDENGTCMGQLVVTCSDHGFLVTDCSVEDMVCVINQEQTAACHVEEPEAQADSGVYQGDVGPDTDVWADVTNNNSSTEPESGCTTTKMVPGQTDWLWLHLLLIGLLSRRRPQTSENKPDSKTMSLDSITAK